MTRNPPNHEADSSEPASKSVSSVRIVRVASGLARWQAQSTLRVLAVACVVLALAIPWAKGLRMNGSFAALLPETALGVRDLRIMKDRAGVSSTLTVAVSGPDRNKVFDFADALGKELERAKFPEVNRVDRSVADFIQFVERNRMQYLGLAELRSLNDGLLKRVRADRQKKDPFDLGLEDPVEAPSWDELEAKGKKALEKGASALPRYERGLFAHSKENVVVIFLRTNVEHGDVPRAEMLLGEVEGVRARVASKLGGDVRLDFGGDFMDATYETKTLTRQMVQATFLTVLLVAGAILFFFRSLRAIPLLCGFLIPPLAMIGAFAAVTVEYLNTSTAFLMSIVIGNGVNPGVMWLSRYFEERRRGLGPEEAALASHLGCGRATFVASGAAALAYGSLVVTDFRGFRDFGLIGGVGMILCWTGAVVLLPALAIFSERIRPIRAASRTSNNPYGTFFRKVALARPGITLVAATVCSAISLVLVTQFFMEDPFEYDFRKLSSIRSPKDRIMWVNARQSEIAPDTQIGNALTVLVPDPKEVGVLEKQLSEYGEKHPNVLGPVRTIDSLLPPDQTEKVKLLTELREELEPLVARANPEEKKRLEAYLPPKDLRELTIEDLPDDITRGFRDKEGKLGRLMYVEHHHTQSRWDGAYWIEWVKSVRALRTTSGGRVSSTGNPVIFADMLSVIREDAPQAMLLSFAATLVLIALSLKRRRSQVATASALILGILWMVGSMAALDLKLHFLNLLAFPIALGNGVDYAVNVVQRFEAELETGKNRQDAAAVSITETGGAVALCSLTTIFGYLSIHVSQNQALRSFAMAMAIAEWTCLVAAVVILPAWLARKRRGPRAEDFKVESLGPA